ncbi:hypothetical protein [Nocardia carnea]|uniref:hypothetical protein n=1 Tax=Nocardia carnea TaxID=37328 RepID=UPI0024544D7A|nr:hypothetical protein [Nocardia carnea]
MSWKDQRYQAVVFVVLVACLLLSVVTGCGSEHADRVGERPAADLSAVPAGVVWVDYQGVKVPVGDDGPHTYTPAAATGFTPTPQGAALAAIVHTVRMSLAPDEHWASVAQHELAMGPGKDEWASSRVLLSIQTGADPATAPRVRGYTITDYSARRARVDIYTSFPDGSIAANSATVVWVAEDWRLELPSPGSAEPTVREEVSVDASVKLEAPL